MELWRLTSFLVALDMTWKKLEPDFFWNGVNSRVILVFAWSYSGVCWSRLRLGLVWDCDGI
jgi:hypothetical protein